MVSQMVNVIRSVLLCLTLASAASAEVPAVNIPPSLRYLNWTDSRGQGSCVHANLCTLLEWNSRFNQAAEWRSLYSGGETHDRMLARLNAKHVRYADTFNKFDVAFLELAIATRRGCGVALSMSASDAFAWDDRNRCNHMVTLVHLDESTAGVIDNRWPTRIVYHDRTQFLKNWKWSYSWAITPVYTPLPPIVVSVPLPPTVR